MRAAVKVIGVTAVAAGLLMGTGTASAAPAQPVSAAKYQQQVKKVRAQAKTIRTLKVRLRTATRATTRARNMCVADTTQRIALMDPNSVFNLLPGVYARLLPLNTDPNWSSSATYSEYSTFSSQYFSFSRHVDHPSP